MANFRSLDSIILSMLDYLRIVQPDLDTKPGSVLRELTVDPIASELARFYVELRSIANLQSVSTATGSSLDKLGRNYGITRGNGSVSSGVGVLTTNSVESDVTIPSSSLITARNGFRFKTIASTAFLAASSSVYKANAIRMRSALEQAGIQDQYALEIGLEAISVGSGGNIGKFNLITHAIGGVSNVTNLEIFDGGSNTEGDVAFRARILGTFAGSNIGTSLGYTNALLSNPKVIDVLAVVPGDPLMIRDGSQVSVNSAGESIVVSSGTGGKVDLYIQGNNLEQNIESVIYRDRSGRNDPTAVINDIILGQRDVNSQLDFQQKRRQLIQQGTLPFQPINNIVSLSGSMSGPNFTQKFTDVDGTEKGSFDLIEDTGVFGGSPFGFDRIHFISGHIDLDNEVTTKGIFNGEDPLDFTDIISVREVKQQTVLRNESPTLSSTDRSIVTLIHAPVASVDRVINLTTGERYTISELNPLGVSGELNTSGTIKIAGSTLPIASDVLQATYLWSNYFDEGIDYDNLASVSDFRTVQDSIDWGFSNRIIGEEYTVEHSISDGYHIVLNNSASRVTNVSTIVEEYKQNILGKIVVGNVITNIINIIDDEGREVYNTYAANGAFSGSEITLPTDTILPNDGYASVFYNKDDLYSPDGYEVGTFSGNIVRLPDDVATVGQTVYADYIAAINTLVSTTPIINLPITGTQNQFSINGTVSGSQPTINRYVANAIVENVKFSPSYLKFSIQGIPSRGRITVKGTSFNRVEDIITVRRSSTSIDLGESLRSHLELSTLPSSVYVAYVAKLERVTVENDLATAIEYSFDLINYELLTNTYSNGRAITNTGLTKTEFAISETQANLDESPTVGERMRIVYYYANTAQVENIVASTAETYYSKFKYVFVDKISVASGFTSISGVIAGNITVQNTNQPVTGTSYSTGYSYTAPKEGERLTVTYNYNKLISDATFLIEDVRPITADVLIKQAASIQVDVEVRIVATAAFAQNTTNLQQNVAETLTTFLTANGLNSTLDSSDIVNALYSVSGVDRVILTKFNRTGLTGIKKTISAGRNEFIAAGTVDVIIEGR